MTARTIGRANRAQGLALEDALDHQHAQYHAQGRAHMTRIPTPVTVLGRTRVDARGRACFPACFASKTGVDFIGFGVVGGRAVPIAVEAKTHSGEDSWDSGVDASGYSVGDVGVTPGQVRQLDTYAHHGIACVVLSAWGATWRIDWRLLLGHVQRVRRRTVRPSEVEAIGARLVGFDWLGVG